MASLIPYIAFPGTCKSALEFYASILNGQITKMQTFKEAPMPVPEAFHHRIFDASLDADGLQIKASDDLPGHEVTQGTNISLFVAFGDPGRRREVFEKLSEEGKVLFPLDENFGMLKDKFEIQWMLVMA